MKPYRQLIEQKLAPLRVRYEALTPREQLLVGAAALVVALALFYLALWMPVVSARRHAERELADNRAVAQRLEVIAASLAAGQNSGAGGPLVSRDASLLSAVDLASKNGTLSKAPTRLQPDGDNQVRVWIDAVQFDSLVRWINELQTRYGVRVENLDVERQPTAGLVNARLSLVRAS
jgi:general secretion pathway protein M